MKRFFIQLILLFSIIASASAEEITINGVTYYVNGTFIEEGAHVHYYEYGSDVTYIRPASLEITEADILGQVTLPVLVKEYFADRKWHEVREDRTFNVTAISERAFSDCKKLRSVTIHEGVTTIGSGAFSGCASLQSVTIPNSVTKIDSGDADVLDFLEQEGNHTSTTWGAFAHCTSLAQLKLPGRLDSIGMGAFYGCTSLAGELTVPESVKYVGYLAFFDCPIEVVYWNAKYAEGDTFSPINPWQNSYRALKPGFNKVKRVVFSDSITKVPDYFFEQAEELQDFSGENIKEIGESCFEYSHCQSISIPATVAKIGKNAFACCKQLEHITLPESLQEISRGCFICCVNLRSLHIPESVSIIGEHAFAVCCRLSDLKLPSSLSEIGYSAFEYCVSLTSLVIPESVTRIGYSAFENCQGLISILIPSGTAEIGSHAFAKEPNARLDFVYEYDYGDYDQDEVPAISLETVTCAIEHPANVAYGEWGNDSRNQFGGDSDYGGIDFDVCQLRVPKASIDEYRATKPWSDFKHIVAIDDDRSDSDVNGDDITDVDDLNIVIKVMLELEMSPVLCRASDVNDDGIVDIEDVNDVISAILRK